MSDDLVAHVKAHAREHYHHDGWDVIVECWDDVQIADAIREADARDPVQAIAAVEVFVRLHREQMDNVMVQSGEHKKCPRCGVWNWIGHRDGECDCKEEG